MKTPCKDCALLHAHKDATIKRLELQLKRQKIHIPVYKVEYYPPGEIGVNNLKEDCV